MAILSWILAIVGFVVGYIVTLAGAMKTVPSLSWKEALFGLPLSLIAAIMAGLKLFGPLPEGVTSRPWLAFGIPLAIAILSLLQVIGTYLSQPGGPR
jgi:hypothetical protein